MDLYRSNCWTKRLVDILQDNNETVGSSGQIAEVPCLSIRYLPGSWIWDTGFRAGLPPVQFSVS